MSTGVEKGVISTAVPVIGIMPLRFLQCTQSQLQRMKYLGGTPDRQALSPTHALPRSISDPHPTHSPPNPTAANTAKRTRTHPFHRKLDHHLITHAHRDRPHPAPTNRSVPTMIKHVSEYTSVGVHFSRAKQRKWRNDPPSGLVIQAGEPVQGCAARGSGGWWLDTRAGQRTRRGASHGRRGLTRPTHQHVDCTVYTLLSPVLAAGSALARSPSRTVLSEALLGTCFGTTSARIDGLMCRYVITTQGACGFARPPAGVRQCRSTRLGIGRPAVGGEAWCVCHC